MYDDHIYDDDHDGCVCWCGEVHEVANGEGVNGIVDHRGIAERLVREWKAEVTDGNFQRHADCTLGEPCSHVDDRLVERITQALVELTEHNRSQWRV